MKLSCISHQNVCEQNAATPLFSETYQAMVGMKTKVD